MLDLSEKQKVGALLRLLEDSLKGDLYLQKEGKDRKIGRIYPIRRGFGKEEGRPDLVIWIDLDMWILGAPVKARFPILIEAEESGWVNAKQDYKIFFGKGETFIPMVVVGGDRRDEAVRTVPANVRLCIKQVPTRLVIKIS